MINVLHYVVDSTNYISEVENLEKRIKQLSNINYSTFFSPMRTLTPLAQTRIREKLISEDILLINPGLQKQHFILEELPNEFPNLKIALLTTIKEYFEENPIKRDYLMGKNKSKIPFFNYQDHQDILDFINSVEASKNK